MPIRRYAFGLFFVLLAACGPRPNAELIISACLDQDGVPLPPGVTVVVDGKTEVWEGEALTFPVHAESPVGLVTVRGDAGDAYRYLSKPQFAVHPGSTRTVALRFFRPYVVTVEALGRQGSRLEDVTVYANGRPLGTTDAEGRLVWTIDRPGASAAPARPGARYAITLVRDGEQARAAPVVLAAHRFAYTTDARLNQNGQVEDEAAVFSGGAPGPRTSGPRRRPPAYTLRRAEARPVVSLLEPDPEPLPPAPTSVPPEPSGTATPPSEPPPRLELTDREKANQAFARGQYDDALAFYRSVAPDDPVAYKQALQRIGQIHLEQHDYQGAVTAFERILALDPSEYAAHYNLAAVYLATESYEEALDHLEQVLAKRHLVPRDRRRETELQVRYVRASIYYTLFRNERDPITKREQGLLTMGVLRAFVDQVPEGTTALADAREEMLEKLEDVREWVREH